MKFTTGLCLLLFMHFIVTVRNHQNATKREPRKLFGGYRITPRICKPTRKSSHSTSGPSICMFNHECSQRNGQVVGACMDGFLFGACCQLPMGAAGGELVKSTVRPYLTSPPYSTTIDITSNGVSQIAESLLNPSVLPTAEDDAVVQIGDEKVSFSTTGITHSVTPSETVLLNEDNSISPEQFKPSTHFPILDDKTTSRTEESTVPYPVVHISVSNAPSFYTPSPSKPFFRPKPYKPSDNDKYVLVPTITHQTKPNKTQEVQSIVNILQMLNESTTRNPNLQYTSKFPTTYLFRKPSTTKPPLSTSYVFSTTVKPRKTTPFTTTTKRKPSTSKKPSNKPNRRKPSTTTYRPLAYSTQASSPEAFITSNKPPTTSYVFSSTPTRRPPSTINTHIAGPSFSVTSAPIIPSPAPTLIVLSSSPETNPPSTYQSRPTYTTSTPQRKPVNSVTINNHVVQNIYSTSEKPPPPQPTVLITPKPSISTSVFPIDYNTDDTIEIETSPDELINFPPVRNPNLNMSNPVLADNDITTPSFVEDDALNEKMESFVNKIIQGLQEPFKGLKDVVYNKNSSFSSATTKKPVKKQGTTTKKPSRPATTTKRPTTKTTTTKRSKTTKKPPTTTTTQSYIEEDNSTLEEDLYRNQCGIRPLLKSGRIVGGKGAIFGKFPWQVLVRESTWLGLFTKNKCGGVLISNRYVITAAHCQPGFLASLVAVFGEFDISGELESKRSVSRNVKRVIVHRQYDAATFENDLALLELESPIQFDAHIIPICLPRDSEDFTGRMATVTGWGRLKYGGGVPSVLQEVQVPIMENHVCQEMFRTAGHSKIILDSFLCAGYANGQKDSCEGDSGGPLVLQRPDGRYQLAGTVSHGIKCAAPYLPGVYMRTTYYKPWLESITGIQSD